jgi:hypothetical protein
MLCQTSVFASCGIYGSRSAFRCIRRAKHDRTILHARWDQYRFDKKCAKTRYAELVFFNLMEFVGHVVHSGASGV